MRLFLWKAKWFFKDWYNWFRFGTIDEIIKDYCQSSPCEIEYRSSRTKKVIGYWAYGHWNPKLPYRG